MNLKFLFVIIIGLSIGALSALLLFGGKEGWFKSDQISGKALVGGPFKLINHLGEPVTEKNFYGKYTLVFFGYTYCPDVCPSELQVMSAALDRLKSKAENIVPIFITIDPERDTAKQMADYVSHFHSKFVGLTGSPEAIQAAARAYRVYYSKSKDSESNSDYLMDHSSIVYLMDRKGEYKTHFSFGTPPEKMAEKISSIIK